MNKKIDNIVFYKWWSRENNEEHSETCVFYQDGTEERMSVEACKRLLFNFMQEKRVKSIDELVSSNHLTFLTKEEFEKRYYEFKPKNNNIHNNVYIESNSNNISEENKSDNLSFVEQLRFEERRKKEEERRKEERWPIDTAEKIIDAVKDLCAYNEKIIKEHKIEGYYLSHTYGGGIFVYNSSWQFYGKKYEEDLCHRRLPTLFCGRTEEEYIMMRQYLKEGLKKLGFNNPIVSLKKQYEEEVIGHYTLPFGTKERPVIDYTGRVGYWVYINISW